MKLLQILLLIGAGVLAGTLITSVWLRPHRPARQAANAPSTSVPVTARAPQPRLPAAVDSAPSASPASASTSAKPYPHHAGSVERRPPPPRRIHPAGKPSPILLAKTKLEPERITPPVSSPPPVNPPPTLSIPPLADAKPEISKHEISPQTTPTPHRVTLYTGLLIPVRLVEALSSETSKAGDTFTATVDQEIIVDGFVIVERGMPVDGVVTAVDRVAALITVELTRLYTADRQRVAIQTDRFEHRPGPPAATLPAKTRIQFRLRTSIQLTEKLG